MDLPDTIIEPRFCETDALGHITNTVLPVWFESARDPLLKAILPTLKIEDWPIIIARLSVDFLEQIYFGSTVKIATGIKVVGTKSFTICQRAYQNGRPVAEGETVVVYFDFNEQKTKVIPDDIREKLEQLTNNLSAHH